MPRCFRLRLGLMLLAACALPGTGAAQSQPASPSGLVNAAPGAASAPDATTPLGRLALATALRLRAETAGDPLLALAALRLAAPVTPASDRALFGAVARDLAQDDAALSALIDETLATDPRGTVSLTPVVLTGTAPARETVQLTDAQSLVFRGQELAEIHVTGDGRSDLDIIVRDENGYEVCRSETPTDAEYCAWTPRVTGGFVIELINHGGEPAIYEVRSN
ncbi:MAG: hypothetical protein AAFR46_07640 [Pseudomonadota bacterium]